MCEDEPIEEGELVEVIEEPEPQPQQEPEPEEKPRIKWGIRRKPLPQKG